MKVLGVDPGLSGALALLDTRTDDLVVHDVPVCRVMTTAKKSRNEINVAELASLVASLAPDCAFIEAVSAMPGQGVTSMFRFGDAFGVVRGVITGALVPVTYVRPQEWQKIVRLPRGSDAGRLRVNQLFPKYSSYFKRVADHNRADAALIAYAGAELVRKKADHPLYDA